MDPASTGMEMRPIPRTGEVLPVIGLGTWQAFDVGDDPAKRNRLKEVMRLFFASGGKMIDTSPMYGRAEAVVGELLSALNARNSAFIATKVWTIGRKAGIAQMRRSAELLRVAVVDLMQIHNLVDWRTQLSTLRQMKEAGSIRYIGITHYTSSALPELSDIMDRERIDFVQLPYSINAREAERRALPAAAERGVAVIANRPFDGGELFRRIEQTRLPDWSREIGCATWAQFFLKFVVSHPAVTCAIPATANPDHLAGNMAAGRGRLPDSRERGRMIEFWRSL